jgi:hypothetical protein
VGSGDDGSSGAPASASLAPFELDSLERDPATICALGRDLRITYVNPSWRAFAQANGLAWGTGRSTVGLPILEVVPGVLRSFHEGLFARVRAEERPVEHSYECSSPTLFRHFRMRIFPCEAGGMIMAHSLVIEVPHSATPSPALERVYRDDNGIIVQCSHCRRFRRADGSAQWDWVPEYVARSPENCSHGICRMCAPYYYPY